MKCDLDHLTGRRHLDVEISCDDIAKQLNVAVLYVPAVLPEMHRDAVGTGLLANYGRRNDAWFNGLARFSNGGDMVDIYVQSCGRHRSYIPRLAFRRICRSSSIIRSVSRKTLTFEPATSFHRTGISA